MKAECFSEMFVIAYQTTRCHNIITVVLSVMRCFLTHRSVTALVDIDFRLARDGNSAKL